MYVHMYMSKHMYIYKALYINYSIYVSTFLVANSGSPKQYRNLMSLILQEIKYYISPRSKQVHMTYIRLCNLKLACD